MESRRNNDASSKMIVMARLEQTELSDVYDKYPAELSGGMQKRTALARALATIQKLCFLMN